MTPLEERLQQALSARAELITHETVAPARPPAPARSWPGRVVMTTTALAAAAAAAVVATVTFTSLGRTGSPAGPAGTDGRPAAIGTTSPGPDNFSTPAPEPTGSRTGDPVDGTATPGQFAAWVQMRPGKLPAGSTASFRGSCPNPGERGTVGSKAFLRDPEHEVDGLGAQAFTAGKGGTFAGSIAVEPDTAPDDYEVFLWCGSPGGDPDQSTRLTVLEVQVPGTDQDIRLAAHKVYPGEWIAFSGVCTGGAAATSGWVMSPAFEVRAGHEYAGAGAVPFTSDDNGVFVGTAHVPEDQKPGTYRVTVRCGGGLLSKTESLQILAP